MALCNSRLALSELAYSNFLRVRDQLCKENMGASMAYRLAYKKTWRFYAEHTPDEAIAMLRQEAGE
jgi:hypothetical protein